MRRFAPYPFVVSSLLFAGACNPGEVSVPAGASDPAPLAAVGPPTEAITKGIPHGGQIVEVAVTESADAALTFDNLLGVRLWPSLDGSRPPVSVTANAPDALSLGHAGSRDLLAVILDSAGTVSVTRLGRDGRVHGRASLPGSFAQAIAIEDGVVARTLDHAIEWYSADGTLRGRILPDPGMQVRTLVARHGEVAALIADAKLGTARTLRYLTMNDVLAWGISISLESPVRNESIALSPSGHRIGYVDLQNNVRVYQLDLVQRQLAGSTTFVRDDANHLGFFDEDHVAAGGGSGDIVVWGVAPKPAPVTATNDPWATSSFVSSMLHQPSEMTHLVDGFAVADNLVVTGYGAALALDDLSRTRYLGWQVTGAGTMSLAGSQMVMAMSGSRSVWLDDKLALVRDLELRPNNVGSWIYAIPVDEHHLLTQTSLDGKYLVELVDLDTKAHSALTTTVPERIWYSPQAHMASVTSGRTIERFKIDTASNTATKLDPLHVKGSPISVELFDPAAAGGITAAVIGWDSNNANHQTLTIYRDKGKPTRVHPFDGSVLDAQPDGTLRTFDRTGLVPEVRVMKGSEVTRKIPVPLAMYATIDHDGSRIAYPASDDVVMVDATGKELWRQRLWSAQQVTFSADGKKLFVRATGGVAVLDAATGIRTALECGWSFGLTEQAIGANPAGVAPVCEDPMLQ